MAAELVNLKNSQGSMDTMAAELAQLKEMMMKLCPTPPLSGTLGDSRQLEAGSNLQNQDITPSSINHHTYVSHQHAAAPGTVPGPDLSHLGAAAVVNQQSSLLEDVSAHIQKNQVPPTTVQPRGGYTGPTMTEIRKDDEINMVAMRVLAALEHRIPQIAKDSFVPQPNQNPSSSVPPPLGFSSYTRPTQPNPCTTTTASFPRPLLSSHVHQPVSYLGTNHPAYAAMSHGAAADTGQGQAAGLHGGVHAVPVQPVASKSTLLSDEEFLDASAIMQLCTVSNRRQLRPHEFAKMGRFSYASKITDKNITVPLYVLGYLQHVVALLKGVVPVQTDTEVVDRLVNLMTIMEITANNSTLDDFKCPGWSIGLEYAGRIFHDIEYGRVKWEDLSEGLQPHTFLYAKDTVEMQQSSRGGRGGGQQRGRGRGRGGRGGIGSNSRYDDTQEGNKVCQSYNGFWTGTGCAYEYNNNRKCGCEHYCSTCYSKSGKKETHKANYCTDQDGRQQTSVNGGNKPAVTTSG